MTRVLVLHGSNDLYGASRVLATDVGILSCLGARVEVLLPYEGPLSPVLARAGAQVSIRPLHVLRRVRRMSMLEWATRAPCVVGRDDVVVLWTLALLPYLPAFRRTGARIVIAVHEVLAGRMAGVLPRVATLSGGTAIANSRATAGWLARNGWSSARIRLAYPVVDVQRSSPPLVPEVPFRILVAGRVSGTKGHVQAVDAVQAMRDLGVEAEITLAGTPFAGQERHLRILEECIAGRSWARYVGEVPDLRTVLVDHHVLLMASQAPESFGLVLLEAWAAGRRSVAPDEAGSAEAARLVEGIVYRPRDHDAMVAALMLVAREQTLRESPGKNAPVARLCTTARRRAVWQEILAGVDG